MNRWTALFSKQNIIRTEAAQKWPVLENLVFNVELINQFSFYPIFKKLPAVNIPQNKVIQLLFVAPQCFLFSIFNISVLKKLYLFGILGIGIWASASAVASALEWKYFV